MMSAEKARVPGLRSLCAKLLIAERARARKEDQDIKSVLIKADVARPRNLSKTRSLISVLGQYPMTSTGSIGRV